MIASIQMPDSILSIQKTIRAIGLSVTLTALAACGGPSQPTENDCADAPNCGQCASMGNASGSCGWCVDDQGERCLPGTSGTAPQNCGGEWAWTPDQCTAAQGASGDTAASDTSGESMSSDTSGGDTSGGDVGAGDGAATGG